MSGHYWCGDDRPYSATISKNEIQIPDNMIIGNRVDVECKDGKYVMDYGESGQVPYKSNVTCPTGELSFIREQTSNGCIGKYCSYSFTGNIIVKSSKTIPTSIMIINQIMSEKLKIDSNI